VSASAFVIQSWIICSIYKKIIKRPNLQAKPPVLIINSANGTTEAMNKPKSCCLILTLQVFE
jgi:hypothetical protein